MKTTIFTALLGCALGTSGWASTLPVNFATPDAGFSQGVSTSATYTLAGGIKLFASGYQGTPSSTLSGTATALYTKNLGLDEIGLGLANDPAGQHEITPGNFIQVSLVQLLGTGDTFSLSINSSTSTETYSLYRSSTAGVAGTFYLSGALETSYSFTSAQIAAAPYISLTATSGNVLLGPGTVTTPTPEPGTLLSMAGAGLMLIAVGLRKQRCAMIAAKCGASK